MKHVIENFKPTGGKHCITHSLKQIFVFEGYPLSEAMLFGLSSSLAFTYINLASSPMVSGRTKSVEADKKLAERLKIKVSCRQPKNYETGFVKVKKLIQQNHPVMIYVDMPYLSYLGMDMMMNKQFSTSVIGIIRIIQFEHHRVRVPMIIIW